MRLGAPQANREAWRVGYCFSRLSAQCLVPATSTAGLCHLDQKLAGGVGLMLRCCGAPADWYGRRKLFQETLGRFHRQWEAMGSSQLILACSTCYEIFKTTPAAPLFLSGKCWMDWGCRKFPPPLCRLLWPSMMPAPPDTRGRFRRVSVTSCRYDWDWGSRSWP